MTNDNAPAETYEPTAGQKKLLRLVYIMGILLVLLFLGLIGGVIWKAMSPRTPAKPQELSMGLGLKAGDIRLMDVNGNTLALTTSSELIVVDVSKRRVLLREPLSP
jgi:predicted lipid-binding transport protein (Tim44 family)